jgi:hypothetical protein
MKGRLNKLAKGWVVEYILPGPPFVGELPLLMDETTFPKDRELFVVGSEVSFEIIEQWEVGDFDMEGMVEYAKIVPEVKEEEPYNYWKERCLVAERFINLSPCDHDIYPDQLIAYNEWIELVNKQITNG